MQVGATGKPLTNVVSVGIGGSFLGPLFVHTTLQTDPEAAECAKGRQLRFLANVDPVDVARSIKDLDPATTLDAASAEQQEVPEHEPVAGSPAAEPSSPSVGANGLEPPAPPSDPTSGDTVQRMAEAILLAVSKIGTVLLNEAVLAVIDKLSRKVDNVKELPAKIKRIDTELKTMNDLAYHVEDVVDKYSYEALKLKDEGFLNRYIFRGSRHIKVFSKIAEGVVELEEEIRQVKGLRDYWSDTVQPINNEHAETIDGGCLRILWELMETGAS
ncbi:hypothetical protein ZWY2020_055016 [Hordeum vulgare]|nr:hypothetical protein ZWY2020_055016 [Hordeum vulgare]